MMDMSDVVAWDDIQLPFTVLRPAVGTMVEGRYTEGTPVSLSRVGVIQPVSAQDAINFLPEGERQNNAITIFCTEDINMGDGMDVRPDEVVFDGQTYRVAFSKNFKHHGYWRVIAVGEAL